MVAFEEEETSVLAKYIGKRFPLAVLLLMLTAYSIYIESEAVFAALMTLDAVLINAYFIDSAQKKAGE